MHTKEKKSKKPAAAAAGRAIMPAPEFTDANASWLKPKAAPSCSTAGNRRVAAAKAAEIRAAEEEGGYSSDSEDAPLPGELSGSDDDQLGLMSGSEDGSEGSPCVTG